MDGDVEVLASFDANATRTGSGSSRNAAAASWSLQGNGIQELLLRRDVFCQLAPHDGAPSSDGATSGSTRGATRAGGL